MEAFRLAFRLRRFRNRLRKTEREIALGDDALPCRVKRVCGDHRHRDDHRNREPTGHLASSE
jgi:hypothetical protein